MGLTTAELLAELSAFPQRQRELDQREHDLIAECRSRSVTWLNVAAHLGLNSSQAAQQRFQSLAKRLAAPPPEPRCLACGQVKP